MICTNKILVFFLLRAETKVYLTSPEPQRVAMVYLFTQVPVIGTTTRILAVIGMQASTVSPVLPTRS